VRSTGLTGVTYEVLCLTGLTGGALSAQVLGEKEFNLVVTPIHPSLGNIKVLSESSRRPRWLNLRTARQRRSGEDGAQQERGASACRDLASRGSDVVLQAPTRLERKGWPPTQAGGLWWRGEQDCNGLFLCFVGDTNENCISSNCKREANGHMPLQIASLLLESV
jgi:hypothetical protein